MVFGENPNKVQNIVRPQVKQFLELYHQQIASHSDIVQVISPTTSEETTFEVDKSPKSVQELMKHLPVAHQQEIKGDYSQELASSLARTVFKSSAIQSIKNIPTAGLIKAIRYSYSKAVKTFSK